MSFMRPTRRQLAQHEAGHAYAYAALTGNPPDELGLIREEDGSHRGWSTRSRLLHPSASSIGLENDEIRWGMRWHANAEIIIALAGPVAECRFRNRARSGSLFPLLMNVDLVLSPDTLDAFGDFHRVRVILQYAYLGCEQTAFRTLLEEAGEVVAANWSSITKLARVLQISQVVNDDALFEQFCNHPARDYSLDARLVGTPTRLQTQSAG